MGTEAKEPEAKVEKPKLEERNGVKRPGNPDSSTGKVWAIADQISAEQGRPALREEVLAACEPLGIHRATIATQYAKWTRFYEVSKEDRKAARDAMKPTEEPSE